MPSGKISGDGSGGKGDGLLGSWSCVYSAILNV